MKIDNWDIFIKIADFSDPDMFYFGQILKRRKDGNDEMNKNSKVIKDFTIGSLEDVERTREFYNEMAKFYNARVCINLNRRSYDKVAKAVIMNAAKYLSDDAPRAVKKVWPTSCGRTNSEPRATKKWIVDIDKKELDYAPLEEWVSALKKYGDVIAVFESPNGHHIITNVFNWNEWHKEFCRTPRKTNQEHLKGKVFDVNIVPDVHKDNPTLLYYEKD